MFQKTHQGKDGHSQKELAELLGKSLTQLTSGPLSEMRFYRTLDTLFNRGYAYEKDPEKKAIAGWRCVRVFLEKIEHWGGQPLQELRAAMQRGNDDAAGKANTRLQHTWGLPHFNGYEMEAIREAYLKPEENEVMNAVESRRMGRRAILGGAATIAAGSLGFVALAPSPSKTNQESNAKQPPLMASLGDPTFLEAVDAVKQEQAKQGSAEDYATLLRSMASFIGGGAIAAIFTVLVTSLNRTERDEHYGGLNAHLHNQLKYIAGRLARGVDPVLEHIARHPDRCYDM